MVVAVLTLLILLDLLELTLSTQPLPARRPLILTRGLPTRPNIPVTRNVHNAPLCLREATRANVGRRGMTDIKNVAYSQT